MSQPSLSSYELSDSLTATHGTIFLSGTQALIRLLLMQRAADREAGLDTRGFLAGYRGSPLGMVDRAAWKAKALFKDEISFLPAINEELGATAVLGTQRVESDPFRTAAGVFSMWYGKGPGVDRAADALKHGNAYGSSPSGGVLVVAGDDHGCVSSSMPHQSDIAFQSMHMPIVSPSNVEDFLEFGLYGWALSRFTGNWVGFTALSEVVESTATVDLDALSSRTGRWRSKPEVLAESGFAPPSDGLHYRWPDLPSTTIEERALRKLDAVRAFAAVNSIDREIVSAADARLGIVTVGKAHWDAMEALRLLGFDAPSLAAAGIRVLKIGLSYPIEPVGMRRFAEGLTDILVVEEKAPIVESQMRELFYNVAARPAIVGKRDVEGRPQIADLAELRPSHLAPVLGRWLAARGIRVTCGAPRDETMAPNIVPLPAAKRSPYFCAGCPHSTSTRLPEGSRAQAGIGCHFMATWMDRSTGGLIQMGGEGVDWVAQSRFSKEKHVFQNLGDGTYFHSGLLAIRQAVAAKATMTYKILFNDAVAMTGGQPVDGPITVDRLARQVEAEGAHPVFVVSDAIAPLRRQAGLFPSSTRFFPRDELNAAQELLRDAPGVSVLIDQQTCAAEKRRKAKATKPAAPQRRAFINEAVCEGCGDCATQSNCVAIVPHDTALGRKRRIDQTACNMDLSCIKGFCPSFVTVTGGALRRPDALLTEAKRKRFDDLVATLARPPSIDAGEPFDLLVCGVGGTGVVTVSAIVGMAAHLEGKRASVLDFMGFAQKGGPVLSFVRIGDAPLHQARIDVAQARTVLACDMVVAASPEALATVRPGRTQIVGNLHAIPLARDLMDPDSAPTLDPLIDRLRASAGERGLHLLDAHAMAEAFLGDSVAVNILLLGYAWQLGLVPAGLPALSRAIDLNGVAVAANHLAFSVGRLLAAAPTEALKLLDEKVAAGPVLRDLDAYLAFAADHLRAYQNARYAARFSALVERARSREMQLAEGDANLPLTRAVAESLLKLMAYKDEYEVARLFTNGDFEARLHQTFTGGFRLSFWMAPPGLQWLFGGGAPRKMEFGPWLLPFLKVLAGLKCLRGTMFDPFGHSGERRSERAAIRLYEEKVVSALDELTLENRSLFVELARLPLTIRGFGHVKAAGLEKAAALDAALRAKIETARRRPVARPDRRSDVEPSRVGVLDDQAVEA